MKKIVLSGFLGGLALLLLEVVFTQLTNLAYPSIAKEYQNTNLFRPWTDPLMSLIFFNPFVVAFIWAWIWDKTKKLFEQKNIWLRGLYFGLVFGVISIPGMLISFASFQISLIMILSWTKMLFLEGILLGWVFAKVNK